MHRFPLCVYIVLLIFKTAFGDDYYSSLLNIEKLIKSEEDLLNKIEDYIETTEALLDECEKALDIWQENHERDMQDPGGFVKVPTNGFKVIKRNTADIDLLHRRFLLPALDDSFNVNETLGSLPNKKDLYETSWALAKLSYTYDIPFLQMLIEGQLWVGQHVEYHTPLSGDAVIVFFSSLFSNKWNILNYLNDECIELIEGAMREVSEMQNDRKTKMTLKFYENMMGYFIKEVSPYGLKGLNNRIIEYFGEVDALLKLDDELIVKIFEVHNADKAKAEKYKQLCQGQLQRSSKLLSKLKCYYLRQSHNHYLRIAPVKVEELNLNPEIFLYHDILTDGQMEALKTYAAPVMNRSKVFNTNSRNEDFPVVSPTRLTHSVKLKPDDLKTTKEVQLLTAAVTGLDTSGFEELSVNIYGVGGYYLQHLDSSTQESTKRAATMLFYLSDVELGGATIFPHFNLTVPALKGKAILWYNLHTSGEMDHRMTHSACPVLLGYKWIATHWIRQMNQTFTRPCLPFEEQSSVEDYEMSRVIIPELSQQ